MTIDPSDASNRNEFFRSQLAWVIDWLRMWVDIAESLPGFVHFTSHRDLSDPRRLLQSVFDRFAVPIEVETVSGYLPDDRRRWGRSPDWRDGLERETIGEAVARIEGRLKPPALLRELCGI